MPPFDTALVFTVAGARLGVRVRHVSEVVAVAALIQTPETPRIIDGFLALDGSLVPIIRMDELLRLDLHSVGCWDPLGSLSHRIVIAKTADGLLGWVASEGMNLVRFSPAELVRLPAGHVLNSCAEVVIARTPPEPSIVLLEPDRVLLEKERTCIEEIRIRMNDRVAAICSTGE